MLYQRTFAFNMGWWSLIFPLGVFILSTYTIGNEIPSKFFKIVGIVSPHLNFCPVFSAEWCFGARF